MINVNSVDDESQMRASGQRVDARQSYNKVVNMTQSERKTDEFLQVDISKISKDHLSELNHQQYLKKKLWMRRLLIGLVILALIGAAVFLFQDCENKGNPQIRYPPMRSPQLPKDTSYQPIYIKTKLQKTYVPDFVCRNDLITNWNQRNAQAYSLKERFKILKTPYPQLNLVLKNGDPSPTYHFPQLVTYLKENPVKQTVYVQSASIYQILLIGASTSQKVSIIIAHDFKQKYLLKTCFVLNNLRDKLIFQDAKDTNSNIHKADILVSVSSDFVARYPAKMTLFYVEQQSRNPNRKAIAKLSQSQACASVKTTSDQRQTLTSGLYIHSSHP